ncbi:MAG: T9SS type A sorting domain-containing protein [Candidatus Woesearchaeota archaeon]
MKLKIMIIFIFSINYVYCQNQNFMIDSIKIKTEIKTNPYFYVTTDPNPFKNIVKFKLFGLFTVVEKKIEFKIFNIYGIEVADLSPEATQNNNGETSEFVSSLGHLTSGVYSARLFFDGFTLVKKFVKC